MADKSEPKSSEQPQSSTSEPASGGQASGGQPATTQTRRGAGPEVFGDGSTREQQQEQIRAAEETNRLVKEAGNAEREARSN